MIPFIPPDEQSGTKRPAAINANGQGIDETSTIRQSPWVICAADSKHHSLSLPSQHCNNDDVSSLNDRQIPAFIPLAP